MLNATKKTADVDFGAAQKCVNDYLVDLERCCKKVFSNLAAKIGRERTF